MMTRLDLWVPGRPAPQGSKDGHMREQSKYLPAWRAAVKKAVYEQYRALGVKPSALPYFRGATELGCHFWLNTGQRIDSPPDLDKLLRGLWDALSAARAWEDDGRVVKIHYAEKRQAVEGQETGASIVIIGSRA